MTFTRWTLAALGVIAGFIGAFTQDQLTPNAADPPLACADVRVTLEDRHECTVPARKGEPGELPDWAADELLDLRVRLLDCQTSARPLKPRILPPLREGDS